MPTTLEDMKVGELKNLLKLEGLPVGGKKAELIARLRTYSGKPKHATKQSPFIANFGRDKRLAKKRERVHLHIL